MNEVTLRPMTADEFRQWSADAIVSYAKDVSSATDVPLDVALRQATDQLPRLLPDGRDTANTWVMVISDGDVGRVGAIWIGVHPENENWAFAVWDITIDEPHQARGLGRAAMFAAERLAADNGYAAIGLNVFGFNERAQQLYTTMGYRVVSTSMVKTLPSGR